MVGVVLETWRMVGMESGKWYRINLGSDRDLNNLTNPLNLCPSYQGHLKLRDKHYSWAQHQSWSQVPSDLAWTSVLCICLEICIQFLHFLCFTYNIWFIWWKILKKVIWPVTAHHKMFEKLHPTFICFFNHKCYFFCWQGKCHVSLIRSFHQESKDYYMLW